MQARTIRHPSVDPATIASLLCLQDAEDPAFLAELLQAYLEESTERLLAIRKGIDAEDRICVQRTAHLLKGSSANVGASRLAGLCRELESASPDCAFRFMDEAWARIVEEAQFVRLEMEGLIKGENGSSRPHA